MALDALIEQEYQEEEARRWCEENPVRAKAWDLAEKIETCYRKMEEILWSVPNFGFETSEIPF